MGAITSDDADRFRPDLSADYDTTGEERDEEGSVTSVGTPEFYFSTRTREIALDTAGIGLVFDLSGILDIDSAPTLQLLLGRAMTARPSFSLLIIDMSRVEFIDSAGLVLLIGLRQETTDIGCRLAIVLGEFPNPQVDRLWQISRFYTLFTTSARVEEAVTAAMAAPDPATIDYPSPGN